MNYIILKRSEETKNYVDVVAQEADKHRDALGFFAKSVYQQFSDKNNLWVLVLDNKYVGHIMFSVAWTKLKITINQTFVKAEYRKQGLAKLLVLELKKWGEKHNFLHIRANVADDLSVANSFYDALGFKAFRQKKGGETKNRQINIRILDLDTPTLLKFNDNRYNLNFTTSYPINSSYKYCLDLNILNDFIKHRAHKHYVDQILKNGLCGNLEVYVSVETKNEIARNLKGENDPLCDMVKLLPVLASPSQEDKNKLFPLIEKLIFEKIDLDSKHKNNMISDVNHVISCISNRCTGFITRDNKILKASKQLFEKFGLEVLSPEEFVYNEDIIESDDGIILEMNSEKIEIEKISDKNTELLNFYLQKNNIGRSDVGLIKYKGLNITSNKKNIAMIIWSMVHKKGEHIVAYVFYELEKTNSVIFDHMLESLFRSLKKDKAKYLTLFVTKDDTKIGKMLSDRGFFLSRDKKFFKYSRFICDGIIGLQNWNQFCEEFEKYTKLSIKSKLSSYKKLKTNGIMIGDNSSYYDFFDFETKISPSMIVSEGRDIKIIPIKPQYAEELIGNDRKRQLSLFNFFKKTAFIKIEKAYFKSPKAGSKINKGDLLMFYESSPTCAMIGVARCTYSEVLSIHEAQKLKRQGVLEEKELKAIAINDKVLALTFDNFYRFDQMIPFKDLQAKGLGKSRFVSVTKTTSQVFLDLCRLGGIYEY